MSARMMPPAAKIYDVRAMYKDSGRNFCDTTGVRIMTFDDFVDALDREFRRTASADYGVYRGPNVAYWHLGDRTARLRAGKHDDAMLDGICDPMHVTCDAPAIDRMVAVLTSLAL
jgi:hypothetical protein